MKATYRKNSHVMVLTDDQLKGLGIVSPVPLGQWNSAIKYQKLNIVRYNGASYIARTSNINVEPTVSPIWQNVWMAVAYDGGSISPNGTYSNMTTGQALALNKFEVTFSPTQWQRNEIVLTATEYQPLAQVTSRTFPVFISDNARPECGVVNGLSVVVTS